MRRSMFLTLALTSLVLAPACGGKSSNQPPQEATKVQLAPNPANVFAKTPAPALTPVFKLAWSPYTSWSALASAEAFGYIDNREGWQGEFERVNGVDVVLQRLDYVPSFGVYGAGAVDALLITNTDAFAVAGERKKAKGDATVAVFPTSWSDGADKILVEDEIKTWADLNGVPVKGAELSVTQYLFWRANTLNGTQSQYGKTYLFENLDPVVGSPQFAGRQDPSFRAFGGWSPETFTVLDGRNGDENKDNDVIDLFNSASLQDYEITDMMVVGQSALDAPGGVAGVKALAEAMQAMTNRSKDPEEQSQTYRAISPNFNDLDNGAISRSMELTHMLGPNDAAIFDSDRFKANMPLVQEFSVIHKLVDNAEAVPMAWGTKQSAPGALLRFDTSLVK